MSERGRHATLKGISVFKTLEVEYLGHCNCKEGLHPAKSKVEDITKAPSPQNITKLRAFLRLINYYWKFCLICM